MYTLTLKRNSWHRSLADKVGWSGRRDLCSYTSAVLLSLVLMIFAGIILLILSASTGAALSWLAAVVQTGFVSQLTTDNYSDLAVVMGLGIMFAFGIVGFSIGAWHVVNGFLDFISLHKLIKSEPGFIVSAYYALKNKTCVRIKFED